MRHRVGYRKLGRISEHRLALLRNQAISLLAHERIEVEDTAVAVIRFASGALGVIQATTSVHPGYPKTIAVHGDNALDGAHDAPS